MMVYIDGSDIKGIVSIEDWEQKASITCKD